MQRRDFLGIAAGTLATATLPGAMFDRSAFAASPVASTTDAEDAAAFLKARRFVSTSAGEIAYVASDHAPSTRAQKLGGSIWDVHFELPGIDTTMPVLLDAAAAGRGHQNGFTRRERVVRVGSARKERRDHPIVGVVGGDP